MRPDGSPHINMQHPDFDGIKKQNYFHSILNGKKDYKDISARPMSDWTVWRLSGQELYTHGETEERKAESPYG